jgi:hypothetical protein
MARFIHPEHPQSARPAIPFIVERLDGKFAVDANCWFIDRRGDSDADTIRFGVFDTRKEAEDFISG